MIELPPELTIQVHHASLGSAVAAVVVALFLLYSLVYQLFIQPDPIVRAFALLQIALLLFTSGYACYASSTRVSAVDFWTRVCYTGVALTPLTFHWLIEAVIERRRPWLNLAMTLFAVGAIGLIWASDHWIITRQLEPLKNHPTMVKGPGFEPFAALVFVLIAGSYARLLRHAAQQPDFYRLGWPLLLAFAVWLLSSLYDGLVATGLIEANAQPWIGPLFITIMLGMFVGKQMARRNADLERRIQELHSLQAVGQALSTSLDLDTILQAIYEQVAQLMPTHLFYVALYDAQADEVSFPLFIEEGRRVHWPARRAGNGLTEYVLRSGRPLLIRRDFDAILDALGIDFIGWQRAACWLGVPISAGDETLGVIAVQSLTTAQFYDLSHQEVLVTIAAQAAVAIQNARLYARTDQALARRVQELDSILRTTRDGVLLLDPDWRVLAANRALVDFVGLTQGEWVGRSLSELEPDGSDNALLERLGYTAAGLRADCQALMGATDCPQKVRLCLPGRSERHVERRLTPVRNPAAVTAGWLLIFRDVTEERNLARLREDLTHMLIHDLRSPLAIIQSCLDLIQQDLRMGCHDELPEALSLARRGSDKMLRMINQLLDISRLESGQMPLTLVPLDVPALLRDAVGRIEPLALSAQIEVDVTHRPNLPPLQADPDLIGRVLDNLLDNAIKFSPDGGRVGLWARLDAQDPRPSLLIGVTDDGPGISPEAQARLFVKFQQLVSPNRRRQGTGLGLPFCKLAVESHGGRIWVESQASQGSTFVVRLPLAGASPSAESIE